MRRTSLLLALLLTLPLLATEPNPSQGQREQVEKLLVLINMDDGMASIVDVMLREVQKQFIDEAVAKGNDPEDIAEAEELFESFRSRATKVDFEGLMHDAFVRIYAKYFNEQELADLIAFYSTPTGRKSVEIMDDLMREGMQAGADHLAPKIEEVMAAATAEHEKKRPWRRTMSDIRKVATALEAYMLDTEDEKYPAGDYDSVKALLEPTYLKDFPEKDIWGHAYAYVPSDDRTRYRLVSAGADSIFDWDSRRIVAAKEGEDIQIRYRDRLEEDIVFEDGAFLQLPVQAKPREKK